MIRLLWSTTDPVDFDGEFTQLRNAVIGLGPYGERPPEIWMPAHRPRVLRATGRLADGWMPIIVDADEYRALLADIRAASRAAGRPADAVRPGLYVWVVCDEDRDVAERLLDSPALRMIALTAPAALYEAAGAEHPLSTRVGADPLRADRARRVRTRWRPPARFRRRSCAATTPGEPPTTS